MICERCDRDFQGLTCLCGWEAPKLAVQKAEPLFLTKECAVEGCSVIIRESIQSQGPAFCKWHQDGKDYARKSPRTLIQTGQYITKAQFGHKLYDAIRLSSAIAYCQQHDPEKVKELEQQLVATLPAISDPNCVRRILGRKSGDRLPIAS